MTNATLRLHPTGRLADRLLRHKEAWALRILERNPGLFAAFDDPENSPVFKTMWHGEYPGKILTGLAQLYRIFGTEDIREMGDRFVAHFKSAQGEDGYLGPWSRVDRLDGAVKKWDTWGHYHCLYGLYGWYRLTGNRDALDVALRAADFLYDYFIGGGRTFVSQEWAECNFAISHLFIILYRETGDGRYLEAARYIVDVEWGLEYPDFYTSRVLRADWLNAASDGKAFYQSNQPRWEGLHTIATLADLWVVTGERRYYDGLEHIWQSIVDCDRHNFGGFGTGEGAEGKPFKGGSETCNTCAWMALSTEYLKVSRNCAAVDELELSYYNAALGSLDEDLYFSYMNNMSGERVRAGEVNAAQGFDGARDMNCCQANGLRGMTQIVEWAFLADEESLYINSFAPCEAEIRLPNGQNTRLSVQSDYPRDGRITLSFSEIDPAEFTIMLRIPAWSKETVVTVNGEPIQNVMPGAYLPIRRTWTVGDTLTVTLDMSLRPLLGADECEGKVSILRGPLLLAASWEKTASAPALELSLNELHLEETDATSAFLRGRLVSDGGTVEVVDYADAYTSGWMYETWFIYGLHRH